jgi:hypothetical protein
MEHAEEHLIIFSVLQNLSKYPSNKRQLLCSNCLFLIFISPISLHWNFGLHFIHIDTFRFTAGLETVVQGRGCPITRQQEND